MVARRPVDGWHSDRPDGRIVGVAVDDFESATYRTVMTARRLGEPEIGEHLAWLPATGM
jgi:hypothetical protein